MNTFKMFILLVVCIILLVIVSPFILVGLIAYLVTRGILLGWELGDKSLEFIVESKIELR